MALSLVDADILLLLVITLNAAVLSRNSSQDEVMPSDQADNDVQKGCPNWQGMLVADGEKYVPNGNDMCMQCTCDKGFPIMCHSVACSPPLQCSSPQQVKEACCEYICLDDRIPRDRNVTDNNGGTEKDDGENITNLSLRLIASTVTSFLVLALLLFMVHRLRQRRLLLAMRRFENQSRQGQADDTDSDPYIPSAFLSLECPPYTDPPPPYSPPKPPQILPGEQPPPYEEINHNIDETNADENRNQIHGVTSSSGSRCGAGQRRASPRNLTQVETNGPCQSDHQRRSFELEHQQSGSDNLRPPNTLPAYASTDVVEGLGVVISPGSDVVCYSAGWSSWLGARTGADRRAVETESASHQRVPHTSHFSSSPGPNVSRIQTMPTTTAFQRFSNIFRRDSWKVKNLRHQGRSISDNSTPPHYATVPRNEQSPRSRVGSSQARGKNTSRPYSNGFPDTLYLSYNAGQATYTLGAISPSTSSSSSSEHYDQTTPIVTTAGSTTTSTTPSASSSGNSASPPHASCLMAGDSLVSPAHRQQFHDDLCRHLPPIQLADVHEVAITNNRGAGTYISSQNPTSTEGISPSAQAPQNSRSVAIDLSLQAFMDSFHQRGGSNLTNLRSLPSTLNTSTTSTLPSDAGHHQQSLASFIRSNPTASTHDSRDHIPGRGAVPLHSLIISNCSITIPSTRESTQLLNSLSTQACSNYFPSLPNGVSSAIQEPRSSKDPAAAIQESRTNKELTAAQKTRSSKDPAAAIQESRTNKELTAAQKNRKCLETEARPNHVLAIAQEFQIPCRSVPPFCGSLPPITAAMVCTTASASMNNIPPASPSPSPPPVTAANIGVLRRSQSGASQNSVFSVCSETGEKKLRPAESCYSEHPSLSRSRPSHYQELQSMPVVMSLLSLVDAPAVCVNGTQHNNPIGCSDACETKCQPIRDFQSVYSQPKITLPVEDNASGGLVPAGTFHSFSDTNSSHPENSCTGSALSSTGDPHAYSTNVNHDEDMWHNSIYNFNSLAEVDKSVAVKDVPSLCDTDQMTHSVNIPPLPPFVSDLSSKILKHCLPVNDDPGGQSKFGKTHEGLKKLKKKQTKDRSISSPQFCNITKQTSSSPKHHCSKAGEANKESPPLQKSDFTLKDKDLTGRALRPGDKKHRTHTATNKQHVRLCDSLNCNKVMTRSAGDAPATYGNADVYRSIGGEGHSNAMTYQAFGPWNQQGVPGSCDHSFAVGTAINDLNQPPSYLKSQAENLSPSHIVDGPLTAKGDIRKKSGHKRQSSSGERAGHTPSPNRYKSRPKSLAAPDTHLNEKRAEVTSARPSLTTGDFGLNGKGARSGFGHDLNFDDQSGIADLHIHEADFGNRRVSIGQDNHTQFGLGPTRKLSRAEGSCDPSNVTTKGGASYGYHPGSRSGLSNELSFTYRPALNGSHNKKRQSLPTGIGGTSLLGPQDRAGVSTNMAARCRHTDGDGHIQAAQARGDRTACLPDRKVDKTAFLDDCIEATSYV